MMGFCDDDLGPMGPLGPLGPWAHGVCFYCFLIVFCCFLLFLIVYYSCLMVFGDHPYKKTSKKQIDKKRGWQRRGIHYQPPWLLKLFFFALYNFFNCGLSFFSYV